ncbi:MAG: DUF3667 domain-containing protein [Bacteroidales bacterium]|nr:DUF3667 domain-containing protein [Bacteroidales bacterium]
MNYFRRTAHKLREYFILLWHGITHPKESKRYDMKGMNQSHTCKNCGLEYKGKFCPRCGQKANIKRLTPRNILSNTLEVWDFNNKSVPGTILELFYRPGHFIRDYLNGHRAPYYAPIKLLFLLCVIWAIEIGTGLVKTNNTVAHEKYSEYEKPENRISADSLEWAWADNDDEDEDYEFKGVLNDSLNQADKLYLDSLVLISGDGSKVDLAKTQDIIADFIIYGKKALKFKEENKGIYIIILNITLAFICWRVFRKEKVLGHLSYTEHFFIQIYISCQMLILSILILPFMKPGASLPNFVLPALMVWDFKQLFQISWWRSLWKTALILILNTAMLILVVSLLIILILLILFVKHGTL